jgi:hypothetical protein
MFESNEDDCILSLDVELHVNRESALQQAFHSWRNYNSHQNCTLAEVAERLEVIMRMSPHGAPRRRVPNSRRPGAHFTTETHFIRYDGPDIFFSKFPADR